MRRWVSVLVVCCVGCGGKSSSPQGDGKSLGDVHRSRSVSAHVTLSESSALKVNGQAIDNAAEIDLTPTLDGTNTLIEATDGLDHKAQFRVRVKASPAL